MGKQKQQCRSAKKNKGGGNKKSGANSATSTNNDGKGDDAPTLKCTACRQIVGPDTSITCPVPECDRIFCTQQCASGCIVPCSNPNCDLPNNVRCRPCSVGKTFELLKRRYTREKSWRWPSQLSKGFISCDIDGCNSLACGLCPYFFICDQCNLHVCVACREAGLHPTGFWNCTSCDKDLCLKCDTTFGIEDNRCTDCAASVVLFDDDSSDESTVLESEAATEMAEDVDAIVLGYAKRLVDSMKLMACANNIIEYRKTPELESAVLPILDSFEENIESNAEPNESYCDEIYRLIDIWHAEDSAIKNGSALSSDDGAELANADGPKTEMVIMHQRVALYKSLVGALNPKVPVIFDSFVKMRQLLSTRRSVCQLEALILDIMSALFKNRQCGFCFGPGKDDGPLKRCGGCKAIFYCDENCQAKNWPTHREHCACMKTARDSYNKRITEKNMATVEGADVTETS